MLEKWKQWAMKMNLRKAVIIFVITGLALAIASSATVYGNFRDRISEWEWISETDGDHGREEKEYDDEHKYDSGDREHGEDFWDREYDGDYKERKEKDWEDTSKRLNLSAGDLALLAGCCIIGMAVGAWYWVLVMIAVYRKAYRMGVNTALWTLAALFFNLTALVVLYLYAIWKGTCTNCGRVKSSGGKFCDRCGSPLKKECPQCGQAVDISFAYCGNCGKKLDEKEG